MCTLYAHVQSGTLLNERFRMTNKLESITRTNAPVKESAPAPVKVERAAPAKVRTFNTPAPAAVRESQVNWDTFDDNILMSISEENVLTLRIDLRKTEYQTEKSYIVCSSHGCKSLENSNLKVNLTIFEPKQKK